MCLQVSHRVTSTTILTMFFSFCVANITYVNKLYHFTFLESDLFRVLHMTSIRMWHTSTKSARQIFRMENAFQFILLRYNSPNRCCIAARKTKPNTAAIMWICSYYVGIYGCSVDICACVCFHALITIVVLWIHTSNEQKFCTENQREIY